MASSAPSIAAPSGRAQTVASGWWQLPVLAIAAGSVALVISTVLLLRGMEPFATWYYNFAWYPVLLIGDGVVALTGGTGRRRRGEFLLLGRPAFLITMLAWSVVVWLFYELFNFRLQNWYYVFLPEARLNRWTGTIVAFATVLPAVFVAEAILSGFGVAVQTRWRRFTVTEAVVRGMRASGAVMLTLVLLWPRYFFPMVWGATMLLVEPENYRRSKQHSLLADLERGRPGRLLRLLLGGACIGLIWELLNINARGKWIYTVPGAEELKLFEMPVAGFLGFPPFAVECFILWQAIVLAGMAVPRFGAAPRAGKARRALIATGAIAFSVGVLLGMERFTVDSHTPSLAGLPNVPADRLAHAGYNVFTLADAAARDVAALTRSSVVDASAWIEQAKLASLRGIGTDHLQLLQRVGVTSISMLSSQNAHELITLLEKQENTDIVDARVRVWIRGARQSVQRAGRLPK